MRGYIFMLATASVIGGAMMLVCGQTKFKKPLSLLASLGMLLIIVSPFRSLKSTGAELADTDVSRFTESVYAAAAETVGDEACRRAEEYIASQIYSEFGIKPIACRISFDSGSEVGTCRISMPQSNIDTDSIARYALGLSGIRTEVTAENDG